MYERTREYHDILVGIDAANCVVILKESFEFADGFRGTTGTILRPVYTAEYEYETSIDGLEEYYQDAWEYAVQTHSTELGLSAWIDYMYFFLAQGRFDFVCLSEYNDKELERVMPNAYDIVGYEPIAVGRIFPDALKDIKTKLSGYDQAAALVSQFEKGI